MDTKEIKDKIEKLRNKIENLNKELFQLEESLRNNKELTFKEKVQIWEETSNPDGSDYSGGSVRDYYFEHVYDGGDRYKTISVFDILERIVSDSKFSDLVDDGAAYCYYKEYETLKDKKSFTGSEEEHKEYCDFIEPYLKDLVRDNIHEFKADW